MEGPSLKLAEAQLQPFKKMVVKRASGNTKLGAEQFTGKEVLDIFSWGKHLVFQFDTVAVRIHFMLFGTYEAEVEGASVTGEYKRARVPRLSFVFDNGRIDMFNCSVKILETKHAKKDYDFSIDILSPKWDETKVRNLAKAQPDEEIADILLDQEIFAGVGNIIKNEVLSLVKLNPRTKICELKPKQLAATVAEARAFSKQFLAWRKKFALRKNLKVHGRGTCPYCGNKLIKEKTGRRERWAYWCPIDQPSMTSEPRRVKTAIPKKKTVKAT